MDLRAQSISLFQTYQERSASLKQDALHEAWRVLTEDIEDPAKTGPNVDHELYMARLNHIALGCLQGKLETISIEIYEWAIREVRRYRETTGNPRHLGTLYANLGFSYFVAGNIDQGVFALLQAAQEDLQTAQVPPSASYALTNMMQDLFTKKVIGFALEKTQEIENSFTLSELENLYTSLGDRGYAFLAYIDIFRRNVENQKHLQSEYAYWQLFSALRNISLVLEVEIKQLAQNDSFSGAITHLYNTEPWWGSYTTGKQQVGESRTSAIPSEQRLDNALQLSPATPSDQFWQSLLIAFITRNYTVHEMSQLNYFSPETLETILGHILYVLAKALHKTTP